MRRVVRLAMFSLPGMGFIGSFSGWGGAGEKIVCAFFHRRGALVYAQFEKVWYMSSKNQPEVERLSPLQESVLKASKEVAVKFIETGRLSVAAFTETFPQIFQTIKKAVEETPDAGKPAPKE